MKKFLHEIKNHSLLSLLLIILSLVFITNYTPNTFLTGWDNLHPEFDFSLNIKRSIFAVWQEYQGLGLLGGMAHASDLPRQIFLWLASSVVPQNNLRYFYHFLMILLGTLGIYKILKDFILSHLEENLKTKASFLGGLFSLFNLGTISYFFVPFEPYSTFFGLFPWEIYFLLKYLKNSSKRNLFYLILINIASIPQAYVQTIFLVYSICIAVLFFSYILSGFSEKINRIKTSLKVFLIILAVNAFWLLPNIYFTISNLSITQNAMQNQMATEKFFQMNKERGTIFDFPLLKEFYFDFLDYNIKTSQPEFLMKTWRDYFSSPLVSVLGYFFFAVSLFGLLQKNIYRKFLTGIFLLCSLVFLSDTPVVSFLNDILRSPPLFNQILRNPFTKLIVPTIFIFSVGFGIGTAKLIDLNLGKKVKHYPLIIFVFLSVLVSFYLYPVFQGNFIAPQMRISIPKEYFDLFSYFDTQDKNTRIMNLPQKNFWGWDYYGFGYRGSGFLWYGIEQPILDRTFDVWSKQSENYYWELTYALKKADKELFNNIIEKYQISYILFDNNLLFTDNIKAEKSILNQETLLRNNIKIEKPIRFGKVSVYKTKLKNRPDKNIISVSNIPEVGTSEPFSIKDEAYKKFNYYLTSDTKQSEIIFPYGSLFTNRFEKEKGFKITENLSNFVFETEVNPGKYILNIPSFSKTEPIIPVRILAKKQGNIISIRFLVIDPLITINKQNIKTNQFIKDLQISLPLKETVSNQILDINNKDYFKLQNLNENFKLIGETFLINSSDANYFRLYSQINIKTEKLPISKFSSVKVCSQPTAQKTSIPKEEILVIQAENEAVCRIYNESLVGNNSLIKVSFEYTSSSDEFPQYCLFSESLQGCLNKKDKIVAGFSKTNKLFEDYLEGNDNLNDKTYFQMILDSTRDEDKNKLKEISYRNINLTYYPYTAGGVISLNNMPQLENYMPLTLIEKSIINIKIPKINSSFSFVNPISENMYKTESLNYDRLTRGSFSLKELFSEVNTKTIRTGAKEASSYLLLKGDNLDAGYGYIANIETKNIRGFPFIVNIFTNNDLRNYVYTFAPKESELNSSYYILPPLYEFDKGINILLGSSSYSRTETINDISSITIYPIPYQYLTNIYLSKQNFLFPNETFTPVDVKKQNISYYEIKARDNKSKIIVLSQSYHSGWKAYELKTENSKLKTFLNTILPFFFGREIKDHVLVNNWENGWNLENYTLSPIPYTLVLIYLPQYLEYLGFGFLLITLLIFGLKKFDNK